MRLRQFLVQPLLIQPLSKQYLLQSRPGRVGQWLSSLQVGQKIGYGYGLALGVAVLGTTMGFVVADAYQQAAQDEKADAIAELSLVSQLQQSLLTVNIHQKDAIIAFREPLLWKQEYAQFLIEKEKLQQVWQAFLSSQGEVSQKITEAEGEEQLIAKMTEEYERLLTDLQTLEVKVLRKKSPRDSESERQKLQAELIDFNNRILLTRVSTVLQALQEFNHQAVQETQKAQADLVVAGNLRLQIIIASLGLSITLATVLAWYISRAIALPIRLTANVAQQVIEKSDFNLQTPVSSQDEVGHLTMAFNRLITEVRRLLLEENEKNAALEDVLKVIQCVKKLTSIKL